jgi:soluble lytic murein transglycosylase-like protein
MRGDVMNREDLIKVVLAAALNADIDPALACAVVSHESSWDTWAVRYEPAFFERYVLSMKGLNPTEMQLRAMSFGLFQIMGQTAREQGFDGRYLTELCDPVNVNQGCRKLKRCLESEAGDVRNALLKFNGGGDAHYPEAVLGHYQDFAYMNSATRKL